MRYFSEINEEILKKICKYFVALIYYYKKHNIKILTVKEIIIMEIK